MALKQMKVNDIVKIGLFIALIAIGAYIQIPLFIIPVTLQYTMVNIATLSLKKYHATFAVGLYILLGLIGIPIFASGSGIGYVFRFGFGYLLGFLAITLICPNIYERIASKTKLASLITILSGWLILYAVALPYCYFLANYVLMTPKAGMQIIQSLFLVFIPGDIFSIIVSTIMIKNINLFTKSRRIQNILNTVKGEDR